MRRADLIGGFAGGLIAAAVASAALAAPERIDRLCGPPGMQLGMSVESWKSLEFPGARPGSVQPVCSDDPGAAEFLGAPVAAAPGQPLVCGYSSRAGSTFLPDTIRVLGGYPAAKLRYYFPKGRLAEIDCVTSDNAFDAAHARFDKLYGPAKQVVRDQAHTEIGPRPRVKETWFFPGGRVSLMDPAQPATDLLLQYKASGS